MRMETIERMIKHGLPRWAPALMACGMTEEDLHTPFQDPDHRQISLVLHAPPVIEATVTGITSPDDHYATSLAALHSQIALTPEVAGRMWWYATVLPYRAHFASGQRLAAPEVRRYMTLARQHARRLNIDPLIVKTQLPDMQSKVNRYLKAVAEASPQGLQEVHDAFWIVMDSPEVRQELLQGANDATIVAGMQAILPALFVRLFAR